MAAYWRAARGSAAGGYLPLRVRGRAELRRAEPPEPMGNGYREHSHYRPTQASEHCLREAGAAVIQSGSHLFDPIKRAGGLVPAPSARRSPPQMPESLEILAIEPFYAGNRRLMLESLHRRSRHRWTMLKLPGRRIERRLEAAAQWFAEVILRKPQFNFDLLFTSEAINLPELYQLCPEIGGKPTVVYFHDNQLPVPGRGVERPVDHVNMLTAVEASEIWFNSLHHLRTFTGRAAALTVAAPHYFNRQALDSVTSRCVLVQPPVEVNAVHEIETAAGFQRDPRTIFVDLRNADTRLLSAGLEVLRRRGETFSLVTIGPRGDLPDSLPRTSLPEFDEDGATFSMASCGVYLSTHLDASFDARAVMALASGMRAVLPDTAAYPEIVPPHFHDSTLYKPHPDFLASAIQDLWALPELSGWDDELHAGVSHYEAESVVNTMDWKLSTLHQKFHAAQTGVPGVGET